MRPNWLVVFAAVAGVVLALGMAFFDRMDADFERVRVASTSETTDVAQLIAPLVVERPAAHRVDTYRPSRSWTWDEMGDCESGDWDRQAHPIAGTARWDDRRGGYEGGLHFLNGTWLQAGGARFAQHAYDATREQQIEVAEDWLARTSLAQWPKCSYVIGAR